MQSVIRIGSRESRLVVKQGDRILKSLTMPKAIPAEMIQIQLKAGDFLTKEPVEVMIDE